jgi:hypothetical protein
MMKSQKTIHDKKRGVLPALLGFNPTFSPDCPHDIPMISHTTKGFLVQSPSFPGLHPRFIPWLQKPTVPKGQSLDWLDTLQEPMLRDRKKTMVGGFNPSEKYESQLG